MLSVSYRHLLHRTCAVLSALHSPLRSGMRTADSTNSTGKSEKARVPLAGPGSGFTAPGSNETLAPGSPPRASPHSFSHYLRAHFGPRGPGPWIAGGGDGGRGPWIAGGGDAGTRGPGPWIAGGGDGAARAGLPLGTGGRARRPRSLRSHIGPGRARLPVPRLQARGTKPEGRRSRAPQTAGIHMWAHPTEPSPTGRAPAAHPLYLHDFRLPAAGAAR